MQESPMMAQFQIVSFVGASINSRYPPTKPISYWDFENFFSSNLFSKFPKGCKEIKSLIDSLVCRHYWVIGQGCHAGFSRKYGHCVPEEFEVRINVPHTIHNSTTDIDHQILVNYSWGDFETHSCWFPLILSRVDIKRFP